MRRFVRPDSWPLQKGLIKTLLPLGLLTFLLFAICLHAGAKDYAPPPIDIIGKVTDEKGEPVPGASGFYCRHQQGYYDK